MSDADRDYESALEGREENQAIVQDAKWAASTSAVVWRLWDEIVQAHEGRLRHPDPEWRALTTRERAVLDFLLGEDFPGVEELRAQAHVAEARRYDRNAPTIELKWTH